MSCNFLQVFSLFFLLHISLPHVKACSLTFFGNTSRKISPLNIQLPWFIFYYFSFIIAVIEQIRANKQTEINLQSKSCVHVWNKCKRGLGEKLIETQLRSENIHSSSVSVRVTQDWPEMMGGKRSYKYTIWPESLSGCGMEGIIRLCWLSVENLWVWNNIFIQNVEVGLEKILIKYSYKKKQY